MLDPLGAWRADFATLPKTLDSSWAVNFANWYYGHIVNNELTGVITAQPPLDFKKGVFASALAASTPQITAAAGVAQFADAWVTADNASVDLKVASGDSVGSPSPATTWSVVSSKILDGSGISAGRSVIMTLVSAAPAIDAMSSEFPPKFKTATETLTGSVSGLNKIIPIPTPLSVSQANVM
jgi:hypothetical protein